MPRPRLTVQDLVGNPTTPAPWYLLRAYWRHVRGPCARCGLAIDYDGVRWLTAVFGDGTCRRTENPAALDVGHIVERDVDRRHWYAPRDTQPEHVRCNRRSGARYVYRKYGGIKRGGAIAKGVSRQW